jgi:hypothetical protein
MTDAPARRRLPLLRGCGAIAAALALMSIAVVAQPLSSGAANQQPAPKLILPKSLKGAAPSSVKIGLAGGYAINFLPAEVAMGAGFLNTVASRFHTSISFDIYGGGSTAEPAFLGGTDQWTVIGTGSYLPANVQGKDQIGVLSEQMQVGPIFLGPAKYASSRGTNVSAYGVPGSTWCQISPTGSSNTGILLLAGINKVNIANQNLTTIGSVANVLPSLQSGQCALVAGDVNSAALGAIQNTSYVVANFETPAATIPAAGEQAGIPLTTSNAFLKQYPQLSQAIVDAVLKALLVIQANSSNANYLYNLLPSAMTATLSLGAFAQTMTYFGPGSDSSWGPTFNNGTFPTQEINDVVSLALATKTLTASQVVNPSLSFANKYVLKGYKDLNAPLPTGPQNGPAKLPSTVGPPSQQMAAAYATITGQAAPANSGPAPMTSLVKPTTTTSAPSSSTTS